MNIQIHPKLIHLSESQIQALIARYYNNEKTHALLREYQIACIPSRLYSLFPPEALDDQKCPYCDIPMVRKRLSRSSRTYRQPDPSCAACGHHGNAGYCRCENCVAEKVILEEMFREEASKKIRAFCQQARPASLHQPAAKDLDLRTAVALLALARTCLFLDVETKDGSAPSHVVLEAIADATIPFAPQGDLANRLLNDLMAQGLIGISELSAADAFTFENGELRGYYLSKVRWSLTVEDPELLLGEISLLAEDPAEWPNHWSRVVKDQWFEIALEECREYLQHAVKERGLREPGEKSIETMLKDLLQYFSVAQCYRIIWAGAQRAADFLVRKRCTRQHAVNYMIGECQRWADRARVENWEVKRFKRNFNLPRSSISHVFFDRFLKIGEDGFDCVPREASMRHAPCSPDHHGFVYEGE